MAATAAPAPTYAPAATVAAPGAAAGAAPTVAQEQAPSYAQLREMLAGGMACSVAAAVTNPMDVVKIRMQVQRAEAHEAHLGASAIKYRGFYQSMTKIVAEEGLLGLILPGMAACLIREFSYSGIRFGLYSHVKELYGVGKGRRLVNGIYTTGLARVTRRPIATSCTPWCTLAAPRACRASTRACPRRRFARRCSQLGKWRVTTTPSTSCAPNIAL
ncbi:hypothetical protein AMAG_14550 [Allomyces macrogynus ATCC 38327]|uniref:Uncharacterized protein n=1 Tax=Allomyces macrogynus (strain ATCC 38327) TaxID=578462 RepID=A0A0L0T6T3_ALLM3|nr:hypothetical protein AMAG_14550 [Allomyces macrogynus ATCC 38327]|eukprot:KNE70416.1 hypothetical protein AMAG_14550 [Allomyces macrogynus ATCC 38327]